MWKHILETYRAEGLFGFGSQKFLLSEKNKKVIYPFMICHKWIDSPFGKVGSLYKAYFMIRTACTSFFVLF